MKLLDEERRFLQRKEEREGLVLVEVGVGRLGRGRRRRGKKIPWTHG